MATYRRRAYSYVNKKGRRVNVPATTVRARTKQVRPTTAHRYSAPAPTARKSAKKWAVDSPLRAVLPSPARVLGKVSVKQGSQRLTQKNATKNAVKRRARKQVRKAIPGTQFLRIKRARARRHR